MESRLGSDLAIATLLVTFTAQISLVTCSVAKEREWACRSVKLRAVTTAEGSFGGRRIHSQNANVRYGAQAGKSGIGRYAELCIATPISRSVFSKAVVQRIRLISDHGKQRELRGHAQRAIIGSSRRRAVTATVGS